jgi:hypothetical protein
MKFFTGCVAAAALVVTAAEAQVPANGPAREPMIAVSDFDGPYAAVPPPPRYRYGYDEERGPPALLPATEVYAVLRDNGFSPLGIPHLRGTVYAIAVIDSRGAGGRLVIDARDGRILRFMPAYDAFGMTRPYDEGAALPEGPHAALPPPTVIRGGPPRPPAPIPHVARRTVPLPKVAPARGETPDVAARPAPAAPAAQQAQAPQASASPHTQPSQQAAAVPAKPAEAVAPTVGEARPAATILPTQEMPPAQGLD